jgi:hypothetical protein
LIVLVSLTPQIKAAQTTSCADQLNKCDLAVKAEVKVNALQAQIIADQKTVIDAQARELNADRAWYHDPFKTIGLGLLGGLITGLYLGLHK